MENHVTSEIDDEGFRFEKRCKVELKHPNVDWQRTWSLAVIGGLESENYSFLWKLVHNLLPTQERLHKILPNITRPSCSICELNGEFNLEHSFFNCSHNHNIPNPYSARGGRFLVSSQIYYWFRSYLVISDFSPF